MVKSVLLLTSVCVAFPLTWHWPGQALRVAVEGMYTAGSQSLRVAWSGEAREVSRPNTCLPQPIDCSFVPFCSTLVDKYRRANVVKISNSFSFCSFCLPSRQYVLFLVFRPACQLCTLDHRLSNCSTFDTKTMCQLVFVCWRVRAYQTRLITG